MTCLRSELFLDLATGLMSRGHRVRFRAEGNSMHPPIRHGEAILVEPVSPAHPFHVPAFQCSKQSNDSVLVPHYSGRSPKGSTRRKNHEAPIKILSLSSHIVSPPGGYYESKPNS